MWRWYWGIKDFYDNYFSDVDKKSFDNKDININKKNKKVKYTKQKFCDRFIK